MENLLCDELVQEIIQRLPPAASFAASLVCKRWLRLHRSCLSSLSLRIPLQNSLIPSLSSFLSLCPHITFLTLISDETSPLFSSSDDSDDDDKSAGNGFVGNPQNSSLLSDLLLRVVASTCSNNLRRLRFFAGPVSPSALLSLSLSCKHLTSLHVSSSFRPLSFRWLACFSSLKELSFTYCCTRTPDYYVQQEEETEFEDHEDFHELGTFELPLETLCLAGIRAGDSGMEWLWKSCRKLRRLQLRSCEGAADGPAFNSFFRCLTGLQELELRTCRSIVDGVLFQLAEHCGTLNSLLVYDGGNRDALLRFIRRSRSSSALQRLDLRLPLDLDNDHLAAVAENFRGIVSIRLQSCCLVTGEGLKTLSSAIGSGLEELGLINCDVVEREQGLLASLGQKLRGLKKLDLSYNEMLSDKELVSMLVSCKDLVEIKLRGCKGITGATMLALLKSCKFLESIDVKQCCGIGIDAVEMFVLNSRRVRKVCVEESKISDAAKASAVAKYVEVFS